MKKFVAAAADRLLTVFVPAQTASACEQYLDYCGCVSMPGNPLIKQHSYRVCCGQYCGGCDGSGEICWS